jgi:methylenetetrahydrofolate reductase (NADPH)
MIFKTLLDKLQNNSYITLETTPEHSATFNPVIEKLEALGLGDKFDGFTTTDNPLAKMKYNAILAAIKLQQAFNKPVLATMSMRDKNIIALQSDMLGANDFDIRSFLFVTGDPAHMSDQPGAKGVFEANSIQLLNMVKYFNAGIDFAGKKINTPPKQIFPFAVSNSYAKNMKTLQKKMAKKIENGALGLVTQPVYDIENAKELLLLFNEAKDPYNKSGDERAKAQIIFGIFPITRLKTAQFLASHVPGIHVPNSWIDALFEANKISDDEEYKVGIELSKKLFRDIHELHPKIHLMTANKFNIAKILINEVR